MKLLPLIEQLGALLVASGIYGLEAEAFASVLNTLLPDLTEEALAEAIQAAEIDWDL